MVLLKVHLGKVSSGSGSVDLARYTLLLSGLLPGAGRVAYRLELPNKLNHILKTFHVFQLRKCLVDDSIVVSLEDKQADKRLNYI